jgi:26S proteasome regulatory subunit N6
MLELNLLKIVHPYSCIEISHVAKLIKLPEIDVERKLSQMILDHRFSGILDQGKGHLIIYENSSEDKAFTKGLEVIGNMSLVVDALFVQAKSVEKTA